MCFVFWYISEMFNILKEQKRRKLRKKKKRGKKFSLKFSPRYMKSSLLYIDAEWLRCSKFNHLWGSIRCQQVDESLMLKLHTLEKFYNPRQSPRILGIWQIFHLYQTPTSFLDPILDWRCSSQAVEHMLCMPKALSSMSCTTPGDKTSTIKNKNYRHFHFYCIYHRNKNIFNKKY